MLGAGALFSDKGWCMYVTKCASRWIYCKVRNIDSNAMRYFNPTGCCDVASYNNLKM